MARFPSSSSATRGGSFRTAGSHWERTWSERLSPLRRDRFLRNGVHALSARPHPVADQCETADCECCSGTVQRDDSPGPIDVVQFRLVSSRKHNYKPWHIQSVAVQNGSVREVKRSMPFGSGRCRQNGLGSKSEMLHDQSDEGPYLIQVYPL